MSKVIFDENELMIMAMFEQDTAGNTKKELAEVLPYVADDMAVRLLVVTDGVFCREIDGAFCRRNQG